MIKAVCTTHSLNPVAPMAGTLFGSGCTFKDSPKKPRFAEVAVRTQYILIVEDEPLVANALARALNLTRDGYAAESCGSAEEALERLDHASFDLLISDWRLPGINGLELIELAHHRNPGLRCVLITAFGSPQVEERALRFSDAYLPKPFRLRDMIQIVRRVLSDSQK